MLLQATGAPVPVSPVEPPHPSPPRTPPNPPSKPGNQDNSKGTHSTLGDIKLLDAWLAVELEVLDLKKREREGEANGDALRDAKKRSRMLWRQVLGMWKLDKLTKVKRKSKARKKRGQGAPVEQVEQDPHDHNFGSLDEMSNSELQMTEEPPCKKPRLGANPGSKPPFECQASAQMVCAQTSNRAKEHPPYSRSPYCMRGSMITWTTRHPPLQVGTGR